MEEKVNLIGVLMHPEIDELIKRNPIVYACYIAEEKRAKRYNSLSSFTSFLVSAVVQLAAQNDELNKRELERLHDSSTGIRRKE